jgi:hypothetical protein
MIAHKFQDMELSVKKLLGKDCGDKMKQKRCQELDDREDCCSYLVVFQEEI